MFLFGYKESHTNSTRDNYGSSICCWDSRNSSSNGLRFTIHANSSIGSNLDRKFFFTSTVIVMTITYQGWRFHISITPLTMIRDASVSVQGTISTQLAIVIYLTTLIASRRPIGKIISSASAKSIAIITLVKSVIVTKTMNISKIVVPNIVV